MERIRVCVVGLGYWGPNILRSINKISTYKLVGIVDLDLHRAEELSKTLNLDVKFSNGLDKFLKDNKVDLVIIATPPKTHYSLAKLALQSGANILVEKPFTENLKNTLEICNLAKELNRKIFVDHTYLFSSAVEKIKMLILNSECGDLQYYTSTRSNLGIIQKDVSVIDDLAIHDFAIINYLFDSEIEEISVFSSTFKPSKNASTANLNMKFKSGALAFVQVSWNSPIKIRNILISSANKSIIWDDVEQINKLKIQSNIIEEFGDVKTRQISYTTSDAIVPYLEVRESLESLLSHVSDSFHTGSDIIGPREILKTQRLLEAANSSLNLNGQVVKVEHGE